MISRREKFDCAMREVKMRKRVYPRWVEAGRLTPQKAEIEIAIMEAIAEDYRDPGLFDGEDGA